MSAMEQVEENVATASRAAPMSAAEHKHVAEMLEENQRLADLYCTGCNYCKPCEQNVEIAENFRLMNYARIYGLTDYARREYAKLHEQGKSADACIQCRECEPRCPQKIAIADQLEEVRKALGEPS
jgi:predicted aldo/keto reductase-like oxidoreductase